MKEKKYSSIARCNDVFFSGRRWRVTPRPFSFYMQRIVFFLSFFFSFYRHIFVLWDPLFSTKKKNTIAAPIVRTTGRTQGGWMHARFNSSFFFDISFFLLLSLLVCFFGTFSTLHIVPLSATVSCSKKEMMLRTSPVPPASPPNSNDG